MKKKEGTTRTVYIFKYIVIKFPLIKIAKAFKHYKSVHGNKRKTELIERALQKRPFYELAYAMNTVRGLLFTGIIQNWNEFLFCIKYRYPKYVAPTFFSFFGLFNIQKYGQELTVDLWKFRNAIDDITKGLSGNDVHVFYRPINFCQVNGHVKCIDYGSRKTQEVLLKYGQKIFDGLII